MAGKVWCEIADQYRIIDKRLVTFYRDISHFSSDTTVAADDYNSHINRLILNKTHTHISAAQTFLNPHDATLL